MIVRNAAYEIIKRKGATFYAVGVGLARIVESILRDQHSVLSVSNRVPGFYGIEDVYLSLPAIVGAGGVERILKLNLDEGETAALQNSAQVNARGHRAAGHSTPLIFISFVS